MSIHVIRPNGQRPLVARHGIVDFALAAQPLLEWGWAAQADDIPPPLALRMPSRPLPTPDF